MPIKLDDPNALEQLTEKLSKRRQLQEMMKEVNAVIRSSKSDDAKIDFIMKKCGKSREEARNFLHPSESWCDPGFAAWELANNNQEIGRLRKRIRETSSAPIWLACITNGISVGIGELISCTVLGVLLVKIIESSKALRKIFAA